MELPCEYDGCDAKFKGDNTGQSIDLLKIHIGAKHHRAYEGQGGGGESIKKNSRLQANGEPSQEVGPEQRGQVQ